MITLVFLCFCFSLVFNSIIYVFGVCLEVSFGTFFLLPIFFFFFFLVSKVLLVIAFLYEYQPIHHATTQLLQYNFFIIRDKNITDGIRHEHFNVV